MLPSRQREEYPETQSFLKTKFTRAVVQEAYDLIKPALHQTPIFTSTSVNSLAQPPLSIYFKAELFQKTGVFKFRGASHAIARIPPSALQNGVVTHSSGNHSAGLACAARERGVKCYIVMVSLIFCGAVKLTI
jgi:threonine dehydratase